MNKTETHFPLLMLVTLMACVVVGFIIIAGRTTPQHVQPYTVNKVEIGTAIVVIPSWQFFDKGKMWEYVSATRKLDAAFVPALASVPVDHAPQATQVAEFIAAPLHNLFRAAEADGVNLVLASAYRSATDQQSVHDSFLAVKGKEYVQNYVAEVGASEHQTGLAVDISSRTTACIKDNAQCSLDATAIVWLRAHAADYGFIERYPEGKQSITGIAGEHWHYRYLGVPLAKALTASHMTFDEFVKQAAPGYAR